MLTKKFKGSIRKKLIWIIILVTSLTTFAGYGSFISWYMQNQYEQAIELSKTIGEVLSQDFAKVILLNEITVAAEISTKLSSFESVKSMVLYKKDTTPIYQYSADNRSFKVNDITINELNESVISGNTLKFHSHASYLGKDIGYIQLNLKINTIYDIIKKHLLIAFLLYGFMLLMSYLLASYFAKYFTNPILNLVSFLETVELFSSLKKRIYTKEDNEFGKLYEEVNIMLKRMEESYEESRISAVAFETHSGMTITDSEHKILKINQAFTDITGFSSKEAIGKTPSLLKSGIQGEQFYLDMMNTLKKHNYWSGEIYNRHKDGSVYPEYLTIQSVLDEDSTPIYYVASFVDLTLQKETEAKLQYLKQYDTLTGLANKELLIELLQKHLHSNKVENFGVLISFDIKEFKLVNDAYGHGYGDLLLQKISSRIKEQFKSSELITRIGADEFILWFKDIGDTKENASIESKNLAQSIINCLSGAFYINDTKVHTLVHLGISLYDETNRDANILFKQSNSALHNAKRQDKEFAFFDAQAQEMALAHIDMYTQLRLALEENQFELFYQLQFYNDTPNGAEALIRWNHPIKGTISPLDFIPIAEKSGLILPIGRWVIEEACRELAKWSQNPKTSSWSIAVNISAKQFKEDNFVEQIVNAVKENNIEYSSLKVELTESIIADDLNQVIEKMKTLQELGIKTSLDDFGTGYSSLEYLKKLPLNQIKIDQSFVRNMLDDKNDIAIIKSILLIGEARGLEVIAEGVETKEHYEFLQGLGCNYFQGYYFAKPQKISNLEL